MSKASLCFCFVLLASFMSPVIASAQELLVGQRFSRVIWVVLENTSYESALRQPDLRRLSEQGVLFTNFNAESRPSQGNYIAMIAGTTFGVRTDDDVNIDQSHLGDLLEGHGRDWRVYAEQYPGGCFTGSRGKYVRKHNPFISFKNVRENPARCAKIVNDKEFDQDFATGKLPAYAMYIPDMNNDGHDTGVDYAGRWLARRFSALFADPQTMQQTLFVVTFDEGAVLGSNKIYTIAFGAGLQPGTKNAQRLNHYSLLKLIEDEFALGNLGREDATAPEIQNIFRTAF